MVRTNVVIDDQLMSQALKCGGYRTKRSAIEAGLRLLVQTKSQQKLRELRGKIKWEGDLEAMRRE
jgi:Arc/MetJ family transcription regulator